MLSLLRAKNGLDLGIDFRQPEGFSVEARWLPF
jgi:hypothetical protein